MSKTNPLVGLIGYGDSDDSDDDVPTKAVEKPRSQPPAPSQAAHDPNAGVHPAPIPHCAWSACYDEGSGFTYYWNQHTNAVTWEAPQEYLMALKLAQHQLHASGSAEVSAEEWQLYQQTLAEKKTQKPLTDARAESLKPGQTVLKNGAKRKPGSDDENEKIELITSYHNSDSESNDEETPSKTPKPTAKPPKPAVPKNPHKKQKTKTVEYGPSLPSNQNYTVPIGPELPPGMVVEETPLAEKEDKDLVKTPPLVDIEDTLEEKTLFQKLKEKAKLLEKLGGEIPTELQEMIKDDTKIASPKVVDETSRDGKIDNIDDLLDEIEKKELPKVKSKKTDLFNEDTNSGKNTPVGTPPRDVKPLFPSSKAIEEAPPLPIITVENGVEKPEIPEKKVNVYLADTVVRESRKKLRIDNSLLPERKKPEVPSYTTKYSEYIEGFSSERTGLGFKEDDIDSPKVATISYGNGLSFTKGEVLNEDKKDEELEDMSDLVEAKLKFLNELQPCQVPPVQEMLIQWQTLLSALRSGALRGEYVRRWLRAAAAQLRALERGAAPPGWSARFLRSEQYAGLSCLARVVAGSQGHFITGLQQGSSLYLGPSEGRYRYRREADGFTQWEYPANEATDMDICTTPPPEEPKEPPPPPPPAPPAAAPPAPRAPPAPPAPPSPPPPPAWRDPPPPGTDEPPPLPPEPKKEIGDELLSFYSDIAELEKCTPPPAPTSPEAPPPLPREPIETPKEVKEKDKTEKTSKKKSKVKISSSIGLKHKTVSSMVAKWQQVADEIHSD